MKLLLDDKQHHGCNLNANEACIFAAILKCTRAGRGWYGNYRELAAAMPFVMSYKTANRAVQKLLTLGLIETREEKLFSVGQIVPDNGQIVPENGQIVLPPNNPPIINNNMNEKEKEQQRALCARDCDEQQDCLFEKFWNLYEPAPEFHNRYGATKVAFEQRSEVAQRAMIASLEEHPGMKGSPNPYFFVVDFPEPQPHFLSGLEQDELRKQGVALVQLKHDGRFLISSTMDVFLSAQDRPCSTSAWDTNSSAHGN